MSNTTRIDLEVLSGPLDGDVVGLEEEGEWSRTGEGQLVFPWDAELGTPQARFRPEEGWWVLEVFDSPHGTYRMNDDTDGPMQGRTHLSEGDVLRASNTWLLVRRIG